MIKLYSTLNRNITYENFRLKDKEYFTLVYEKYWYKLYIIGYNRLRDKEICEELVQDVFVKLWEKRETLDVENLENYLTKSMKYKVIDHIRSQVSQNNYAAYYQCYVDIQQSQTEDTIALNDLQNLLEIGLNTLPEKSREIFRLSRFESWPISQIAVHLRISEKGVEYHLTKSLKKLRAYLKEFVIGMLFFLFL